MIIPTEDYKTLQQIFMARLIATGVEVIAENDSLWRENEDIEVIIFNRSFWNNELVVWFRLYVSLSTHAWEGLPTFWIELIQGILHIKTQLTP